MFEFRRSVIRPLLRVARIPLRPATAAALAIALLCAACSKPQATQARSRPEGNRKIKTEAVRQDSLRRTLEVVGTLAAEDQVTISSQAEGAVSRIDVDLGDRVRNGQVLVELDREKAEYNLDQQRAALARALA